MINSHEKKGLKAILGNHYTNLVIEVLEAKGIKDTKGNIHSTQMIREVFNGNREHLEIEEAILEAAAIEKKRQKTLARKKKQLLKSA